MGCHYATAHSPASLTLLPCKQVEPPHIWGPDVGLSHRRLMAYVKLHHDNYICPIKAVISGVGFCAPQEFFLKTNGHYDWQTQAVNMR